jgi:putative cell wall-binding protein
MKKSIAAFLLVMAISSVGIAAAQAPLANVEAPPVAVPAGPTLLPPPPVLKGGVYILTLGLLKMILEEMNLRAKPFHTGPITLAATLTSAGEYPAPTFPFLTALLTTPVEEVATPERLVKDITVLSPETTEEFYAISTQRVMRKYMIAPTVIVARRDPPVDGIASVGFSRHIGAPILPVERDTVPEPTIRAIKNLKATRIILLGGPEAISDRVEKRLRELGRVERVWGPTRFETAVKLAERIEAPGVIVVTDGLNPSADALIIAGAYEAPIVYVRGRSIPVATERYLLENKESEEYEVVSWVVVGVDREVSAEIKALYDLPEFFTKQKIFRKIYKVGTKVLALATGEY